MNRAADGVWIGVDIGSVRVGVAASDRGGQVVLGVTTLPRDEGTVPALVALVTERAAVAVVVGLPLGLDGREGRAAVAARTFAGDLAAAVAPVPVRLVDERLTTAAAIRDLQPTRGRDGRSRRGATGAGRRPRDRHLDSRALRTVVDQHAAVMILQTALANEQATGAPPGQRVGASSATDGGTR